MRAVFFDLDGTLVSLPDDFDAIFEAALDDHGVRADPDRRDRFTEALFDAIGACHPNPHRVAMADLCATFDLDADPVALAETYVDHEVAATELRPGVRDTLDALAASTDPDYALGVLTNGGGAAQRRKLDRHDIADDFEAVVVSGEIGAMKPDPEIFDAARTAIPADEYVFVGDDCERDVLPAQSNGFTGVWVSDPGESADTPDDADDRADATIESFGAVPDILE